MPFFNPGTALCSGALQVVDGADDMLCTDDVRNVVNKRVLLRYMRTRTRGKDMCIEKDRTEEKIKDILSEQTYTATIEDDALRGYTLLLRIRNRESYWIIDERHGSTNDHLTEYS
jgi:hypothetical protein